MNLHQVGFRCFFWLDEFSVLFWLHKLADSWHPWPDGHLRPQQMTETLQHMNLGLASLQGSLVSAAWLTVRWTMALGHQNLRGDFMIFHDSFGFDGYFWWTFASDNGGLEVQHQVSLDHGRFIRLVGEASGCLLQCHFPALELLWDDRWSKSSQWDTSHDFHFHLSRNLSHLQSLTADVMMMMMMMMCEIDRRSGGWRRHCRGAGKQSRAGRMAQFQRRRKTCLYICRNRCRGPDRDLDT